MDQPSQPAPITGRILSTHVHPRPRLRRIGARLLAIGLILAAVAAVIQLVLALVLGPFGVLFVGSAAFTLILTIPLLLHSVLHPAVALTSDGLILYPMLWRPAFVPRSALRRITRHPLMQDRSVVERSGRVLFGKNFRPREGVAIAVDGSARLPPLYRMLGGYVGARYAFALSTATHTDYAKLVEAIAAWIDG